MNRKRRVVQKNVNLIKGTPMSKKEVHLLLDLVSSRPILCSRNTKSTVNKLKRRAWTDIEVEFNAKNDQIRPKEQLSLRWANLKKTCRRKFKTCGGNLELADREDGVLERVLSLLDGSPSSVEANDVPCDEVSDSGSYSIDDNDTTGVSEYGYIPDGEDISEQSTTTDRIEHKRRSQGAKVKDIGIKEHQLAMAEYYEKKAKIIDIERKLLKLQFLNKKRKLMAN